MKQNNYLSHLYLEFYNTPWYYIRKRAIIKNKIESCLASENLKRGMYKAGQKAIHSCLAKD